jgi:hypothetical protein
MNLRVRTSMRRGEELEQVTTALARVFKIALKQG